MTPPTKPLSVKAKQNEAPTGPDVFSPTVRLRAPPSPRAVQTDICSHLKLSRNAARSRSCNTPPASSPCSAQSSTTEPFPEGVFSVGSGTPSTAGGEASPWVLPGGATRSWYVGFSSLMVSSITWMVPMKMPARQP